MWFLLTGSYVHEGKSMRSVSHSQLIGVALLGFLELLLLVVMLQDYNAPLGQYGFITAGDGVTITSVESKKPAALAKIMPGDRINYHSLDLFGRHFLTLKEPVTANTPLSLELIRDGQSRFVTLYSEPMPIRYVKTTTIISGISGFVFGIIGLILVVFRPSRMTWAFALIAPELLLPSYFPFLAQHTENHEGMYFDIFIAVISALQMSGMLIFASRFPHNKPQGWAAIIDRVSVPAGIVIAFIYIFVAAMLRFSQFQFPYWLYVSDCITLIGVLAALTALISTMVTTERSTKSRLAPVIISFTILIILGALQQITPDVSSNYNLLFTISLAYAIAPVLVAITVAYGVIRYRVMDINFILERTLVFSVLTTAIIVCFAIIEFFVGKLVEERVAEIVQMAAAVIIGISIQYLHIKLEHIVKVFFFRRRYESTKQLNKSAHLIQHASSFTFVDSILVTEPFAVLGLASAALFRKNNQGDYERVAACGWDNNATTLLTRDDYLVVRLAAQMKILNIEEVHWQRTDFPEGVASPILFIPILVGNQLQAIVCYSAHLTGEGIAIDERKGLQHMAKSAALAYVQLFQATLNEKIKTLQNEVDNIQNVNKLLERIISLQMRLRI
jgi:hypothetical protein